MTNTPNLTLPMLEGNQAQKHVTLNESLSLLDGLSQLAIVSRSITQPTETEVDGSVFFVPTGAVDAWGGQDGKLAIRVNSSWRFVSPKIGWQGYIDDEAAQFLWDGVQWGAAASVGSVNGARTTHHVVEIDHVITTGSQNTTTLDIPKYALVYGVTGRILTEITGTLTSWNVGISVAQTRYANSIGVAQGSWINGPSTRIITYYNSVPIVISADGGDFAGGVVRLALHYDIMTPPGA